jgi:SAM-dependent methyltransferase
MNEEDFVRDLQRYQSMPWSEPLFMENLQPCLTDDTPTSGYDSHYFYQDIWAFKRVLASGAKRHVDVGSRVDYVGFLSAVTDVTFVDIRPLMVNLERFRCMPGSILAMPFDDGSCASLSCLHVAEHIGLGRYGDPLNPLGTVEAARELERVLAPGGDLYFSLPVGRPRVCFNAHRIHSVEQILSYFSGLDLVGFSCVDDSGFFHEDVDPRALSSASYACGMFHFRKASAGGATDAVTATTREPEPIFCVGDSHVCFFSGQDKIGECAPLTGDDLMPLFRTYWLGPVLAYNLIESGTTTLGREKLHSLLSTGAIPVGSRILLSAGEIDCRMHLLKQAGSQGRPLESVVQECVQRYLGALLELKIGGWRPMVWAVVPSGDPDETQANPDWPHWGTVEQRNETVALFNRELERVMPANGIPVVSIYESINSEGRQRPEYFMDPFHLSQTAMPLAIEAVKEALEQLARPD